MIASSKWTIGLLTADTCHFGPLEMQLQSMFEDNQHLNNANWFQLSCWANLRELWSTCLLTRCVHQCHPGQSDLSCFRHFFVNGSGMAQILNTGKGQIAPAVERGADIVVIRSAQSCCLCGHHWRECNVFCSDHVQRLLFCFASENPINGKTLHKGPVAHVMVM